MSSLSGPVLFLRLPFGCLGGLAAVLIVSLPILLAPSRATAQLVPPGEGPGEQVAPEPGSGPEQALPQQALPEEVQAEEALPEEALPEEALPEEALPEEPQLQETPPGAPLPAEDQPGEAQTPGSWDVSRPCENVQHPYEADLCQQWRTAQAAETTAAAAQRTAGLTRLLMLIGLAGAFLLLLMFIPVFLAASSARRAALGSSPSPSNPDNRENELRAYVDVDGLEFIETPESEGVVKVKVTLRNSGQTPAFKLQSATDMGVSDVADEDLLPVMPLPERSSLDTASPRLGRDATATEVVQCKSQPKLADKVTDGDATILVWGLVEYTDVFDAKRKTTFQFLCNAETLDTGQVFKPMVRGDEDG